MKKKEKTNIHSAGFPELTKIIREAQAKLIQIQMTRATKPSKNTREARTIRNTIAVAKTMMREKELQHA